MAELLFHYTDGQGWKSISSQTGWMFKAGQPPRPDAHPRGAYFTRLPVETPNLTKLLRMPRRKVEFFFSFLDVGDLRRLEGGRGDFISYSPRDYLVSEPRQHKHGSVSEAKEQEQ